MAKLRVSLDTNDVKTFYRVLDDYIKTAASAKNKDTLSGLYDMFESGDMAGEISDMLQMMESKTSPKPLLKEFKRIGGTK
tara:strand:- start:88 stop:327 length:240 start_codon:yes stop_codon:yes gene_type:complete